MSVFIPRNTSIPHITTKLFSTFIDNQTEVELEIYEGERAEVEKNNLLGKFELEGIPPAPAGHAKIEVTFQLDANGILTVSAKDQATGRAASVEINDSCRLDAEEVKLLVREATLYKAADEKRLKKQRLRAHLAKEIADIDKTINDSKLHIGKKEYDTITNCIVWLQAWLRNNADRQETLEATAYVEQLTKLGQYVDPILSELFKGRNLSSRNMGLFHQQKRKITALIQTQEYKALKMAQQQTPATATAGNNPHKRAKTGT
jgi:molecular chaperone DnaK (HSP70)